MKKVGTIVALITARLVLYGMFAHGNHASYAAPAPVAASTDDAPAYSAGPWSKDPPKTALTVGAYQHPNSASGPVTLSRDSTGHFAIAGEINGHSAPFLIDTGADLVSIPADQAAQYGISVDPGSFRPILRTASGTGMGAVVHIDELYVAGVQLHDVDAVVAQGLTQNLLGQSALRKLGKVSQDGDSMTIVPNAN